MAYRFVTCDVFTTTMFGGNPLAVIPDARGLSSQQMQQIAREFNYSESTFVLPPEQGHDHRVRIFTPTQEIPFAGHPNVGTAAVLSALGAFGDFTGDKEVVLEEDAGLVAITITVAEEKATVCELTAPQPISIGEPLSVERVASALHLDPGQILTSVHPPVVASVGLPFIVVEVADRAALEAARSDVAVMEGLRADGITPDIHVYVRSDDDFDIRCRMFAPLDGVPEDPATGSANCALTGLLAHHHSEPSGELSWRIAQGVEMGRPSELASRARKEDGVVTDIWIGGATVVVAAGQLDIDPAE